jgi:hypothetical protein
MGKQTLTLTCPKGLTLQQKHGNTSFLASTEALPGLTHTCPHAAMKIV